MKKKWYYPLAKVNDDDKRNEVEDDDAEDNVDEYKYVGKYFDGKEGDEKERHESVEPEGEEKEVHWTDVCHPVLRKALLKKMGMTESDIPPSDDAHNSGHFQAYPFTHTIREAPSLAKAWAYFDHVALSRYVDNGKKLSCCANPQLNRAEPGERGMKTSLYSPLLTPHSQLGDFGLGVGM